MHKNFDEIIKKYRQRISKDERLEDVIAGLHTDGLTITDSMKALRLLYRINLRDAKRAVTAHSVWSSVVRANEPFHEELEKLAEAWSNNPLTDFNTMVSKEEKHERKHSDSGNCSM